MVSWAGLPAEGDALEGAVWEASRGSEKVVIAGRGMGWLLLATLDALKRDKKGWE